MKRKIFFVVLGLIVASLFLFWATYDMKLTLTASVILLFFYFVGLCLFTLVRYLIVKRWVNRKHFTNVLWLFVIAVVGHFCIFLRLPEPLPKAEMSVSEKMEYILQTDQSDRAAALLLIFTIKRDRMRFKYVQDLLAQGVIRHPQDKYCAAMVLHHNGEQNPKIYEKAHQLAQEVMKEKEQLDDEDDAKWIYEITYDRWQMSMGKKQKYNTQNRPTFKRNKMERLAQKHSFPC